MKLNKKKIIVCLRISAAVLVLFAISSRFIFLKYAEAQLLDPVAAGLCEAVTSDFRNKMHIDPNPYHYLQPYQVICSHDEGFTPETTIPMKDDERDRWNRTNSLCFLVRAAYRDTEHGGNRAHCRIYNDESGSYGDYWSLECSMQGGNDGVLCAARCIWWDPNL